MNQYFRTCTNKFKPQSNSRGQLTTAPKFFEHFKIAEGYDQKMSQRSERFRGLVQLTNPRDRGFPSYGFPETPPSNVLRR